MKIIFTDYLTDYNAYSLKDKLKLSNFGTVKLLKRLENDNLLTSKKMGNATFYKLNVGNEYAIKLLELSFMEHNELPTYVKGWLHDLTHFEEDSKTVLLFGSVLSKGKKAKDIDVCFVLESHNNYKKVQAKINKLNEKSRQKIHPLFLTEDDFENKLVEKDMPVIDIIRSCLVVCGQELFIRVIKNVQN